MSAAEVERLARLAKFREAHRAKLRASSTDEYEVRASVKHTSASLKAIAATGGDALTFLCTACVRTDENTECVCPSCVRETVRASALKAAALDTECVEDDEGALDTAPGRPMRVLSPGAPLRAPFIGDWEQTRTSSGVAIAEGSTLLTVPPGAMPRVDRFPLPKRASPRGVSLRGWFERVGPARDVYDHGTCDSVSLEACCRNGPVRYRFARPNAPAAGVEPLWTPRVAVRV